MGNRLVYARKLEQRPHSDTEAWTAEPRWPRSARLAFLIVAAALCWAVPIGIAYLLVGT